MEDPDPARWQGLTTVVVGSQLTKFLVHTSKLREIPFFRACLDAPMKESAEGIVNLPEDDPAAFSEILDWLYQKKFDVDLSKICVGNPNESHDTAIVNLRITRVRTYMLASKLIMNPLQNAVIDSLRLAWFDLLPSADELRLIFNDVEKEDKLHEMARRLLPFRICKAGGWDKWKAHESDLYSDLLQGNAELLDIALSAVSSFPEEEWNNSVAKLPARYFHVSH